MKNELKMLTEIKEFRQSCTFDEYIKDGKRSKCLVSNTSCNECIFEGGYITESNKKLQEIIPIISLEDS